MSFRFYQCRMDSYLQQFCVYSVKTAVNAPDTGESLSPDGKPWTSFLMELREPAPIPEPHEFARFLSTCLGFTVNINSVSSKFPRSLDLESELRSLTPPFVLFSALRQPRNIFAWLPS